MSKINLTLHINEVNLIIKALSELPFREVYELMGKIHEQSNNQLKNGQDKLAPNNKTTSQ
ncbi:MAG: hypothetical protein MI674_07605 [Cytophagales bacterium]|nr:hypothetical protein [Cytophagales bacterium]